MATQHLVKHLKVLGKGADPNLLGSTKRLAQLCEDLVELVGMRLLDTPKAYAVELQIHKLGQEPFEDEGGISVLGCLSTSHIAIHGWPLRQEYHLDLYSCREFNPAPVLDELRRRLCGDLQAIDVSSAGVWAAPTAVGAPPRVSAGWMQPTGN